MPELVRRFVKFIIHQS